MDERIYITIAKALSNEATAVELSELDAWLQQDAGNQKIYDDMKEVWGESDLLLDGPEFDTATAWDKVAARTIAIPEQKKTRIIAFPQWAKLSAVAAVLVIGFLGYRFLQEGKSETVLAESGNRVVILPDNSTITLKKGSSISYPGRFAANERHVALKGEAFFEVTRNERQPFVIAAQSVNVKVLGTSFDVVSDDTSATVVVATGKVRVTNSRAASTDLILMAGRKGTLSNGVLVESPASNGNDFYWKTGQLNFVDQPLNKVVSVIQKAKDTVVIVDPSLPLDQQQQLVTISFNKQSLEEMLTELCLITHTRWAKEGNRYIIKPK